MTPALTTDDPPLTADDRPPTTLRAVPTDELERLTAHLAGEPSDGVWRDWRIARVGGGSNNLLYRAAGHGHDLAVKFTLRDSRDRAGREYAALAALRAVGPDLAPIPLYLDQTSFAQPVIVMTWLDGPVSETPPTTDREWNALLAHLLAVHTVTPGGASEDIPPAVMTMLDVPDGLRRIEAQVDRLPPGEHLLPVDALVEAITVTDWPEWPPAQVSLCRSDPNLSNFVRRSGRWASVDWENAGWGDPAFEIADLLCHPTTLTVPPERAAWVVDRYATLRGDSALPQRVAVYQRLLLVWWVARLARFLYEVPRGLDPRLVDRPANWQAEAERKYQLYVDRTRSWTRVRRRVR